MSPSPDDEKAQQIIIAASTILAQKGYSATTISLDTGVYTLAFSDIPDWDTPSTQSVTILKDMLTTATGIYIRQTGSLRVTIAPQEAIDAGAQWRRSGTMTWLAV